MTLKDFGLKEGNHFVAMEYYGLILNRTFLILLTKDSLIGLQGNGIISAEAAGRGLSTSLVNLMAVRGDLSNPYSYLKDKYIHAIENEDLLDGSILKKNKTNFIIPRKDITGVKYDARKKWGMGNYPHDGKVYVSTAGGKKREFIILGNQSGQQIANMILAG